MAAKNKIQSKNGIINFTRKYLNNLFKIRLKN